MKINNKRFSIAFCNAMDVLGIITVGQAKKFLAKVKPSVKIHQTRSTYLKKELDQFLKKETTSWGTGKF